MKQIWKRWIAMLSAAVMLVGCGGQESAIGNENAAGTENTVSENVVQQATEKKMFEGATVIELSDGGITVDDSAISEDEERAVYAANDIIFYLEGQGFTYGEGTEADAHSQEEADAHTVVHITQPGTYAVSGSLSAGQIAIDLGEDAEEDPEAVVTLILNGVDINCTVAPAVIFYNVYECGDSDAERATRDVDTSAAGANVLIADGTVNHVSGSYVARIYKSYELNEAGTEVVDSKKLHKYDAAFYSRKSMNVNGDELGTGVLNITAENEGLDSELHLTINGGNINITSGNDGINTNEDEVSVTTVNGGVLHIKVNGKTGEGDGIDSNGWLVINGGTVIAQACSFSGDAGIDSDMGIHINGGTVIATGNMLDSISESAQNYAVFQFTAGQVGGTVYTMKNADGEVVFEHKPENDFAYLIVSSKELAAGTYTLWSGKTQLSASAGGAMGGSGMRGGKPGDMPGGFGGGMPDGFRGEMPEGMTPPEGMVPPEGMTPPGGKGLPEGMTPPEGMIPPMGMQDQDGVNPTEADKIDKGFVIPEGVAGGGRGGHGKGDFGMGGNVELSTEIVIVDGGNYFSNVTAMK